MPIDLVRYDRWGNRLTQTVTQGSGPQPSFSFNTANNQIVGYTYDALGNVLNDGIHTYSYDAENNVTAIDGGSTASYAYDALNERVQVSTAAGTELYDFDLNGRRATTWSLSSTNITAAQYYAGASRVAYWTAADNNIHFEHQDWLGTERARTNPAGAVEGSYTSLPFGDNAQVSGSDTNAGHFAMLDQDVSASAGLSHAMFREYSATAGRWTSPDPYAGSYDLLTPQSFNRYSYAMNNPLRSVDPSGLYCEYFADNDDVHGDGILEETDYDSSADECAATGGSWSPDGGATYGGPPVGTGSLGDIGSIPSSPPPDYPSGGFGNPGAPNNQPPQKQPYNGTTYRIPLVSHTNYCGPGGYGPTLTRVDAACKQHDACYSDARASWFDNMFGTGGAAKQAAIQACNVQLCHTLQNILYDWPTSQEAGQATLVGAAFGCMP